MTGKGKGNSNSDGQTMVLVASDPQQDDATAPTGCWARLKHNPAQSYRDLYAYAEPARLFVGTTVDTVVKGFVFSLLPLALVAATYVKWLPQQTLDAIPDSVDGIQPQCGSFSAWGQFFDWFNTNQLNAICSGLPPEGIRVRGAANLIPEMGVFYVFPMALIALFTVAGIIRATAERRRIVTSSFTVQERVKNTHQSLMLRRQSAHDWSSVLSPIPSIVLAAVPAVQISSFLYRLWHSVSLNQVAYQVTPAAVGQLAHAFSDKTRIMSHMVSGMNALASAAVPFSGDDLWQLHESLGDLTAGANNTLAITSALAQTTNEHLRARLSEVLANTAKYVEVMGDSGWKLVPECDLATMKQLWGKAFNHKNEVIYDCVSQFTNNEIAMSIQGYPIVLSQSSPSNTLRDVLTIAGTTAWTNVFLWMLVVSVVAVGVGMVDLYYKRTTGKGGRVPDATDSNRSRNKSMFPLEWLKEKIHDMDQSQSVAASMVRTLFAAKSIAIIALMSLYFLPNYYSQKNASFDEAMKFWNTTRETHSTAIFTYELTQQAYEHDAEISSVLGGLAVSEVLLGPAFVGLVTLAVSTVAAGVGAFSWLSTCLCSKTGERQPLQSGSAKLGYQAVDGTFDADKPRSSVNCGTTTAQSVAAYVSATSTLLSLCIVTGCVWLAFSTVDHIFSYDTQYCDPQQTCPSGPIGIAENLYAFPSMLSANCSATTQQACNSEAVLSGWKDCFISFVTIGSHSIVPSAAVAAAAGIAVVALRKCWNQQKVDALLEPWDYQKEENRLQMA